MSSAIFRVEVLDSRHDRKGFSCGDGALDRYFQTQVTQDIRRRVANCFLIIESDTGQIAGFYTLAAASIPLTDLPVDELKKLPRYPAVPAVRIGRLNIPKAWCGRVDDCECSAVQQTARDSAAAFCLVVDAKNDSAAAFYKRFGFRPIVDRPLLLYLPLANVQKAIGGEEVR